MGRLSLERLKEIKSYVRDAWGIPGFRLLQDLLSAYEDVTQFENPTPVVVGLVTVRDEKGRIGLITGRRGIEPGRGKLGLPGGYLEIEDWREGLRREIREEMGLELTCPLEPVDVISTASGKMVLIFAMATKEIDASDLAPFVPNDEVTERVIIYEPTGLAFPSHTQVVKSFFETILLRDI